MTEPAKRKDYCGHGSDGWCELCTTAKRESLEREVVEAALALDEFQLEEDAGTTQGHSEVSARHHKACENLRAYRRSHT